VQLFTMITQGFCRLSGRFVVLRWFVESCCVGASTLVIGASQLTPVRNCLETFISTKQMVTTTVDMNQ